MNLPQFPSHSNCTLCHLHQAVPPGQHVGVPTIWEPDSLMPDHDRSALVFIGQNPGKFEGEWNEPFVGITGIRLRGGLLSSKKQPTRDLSGGTRVKGIYLDGFRFRERASIYLTNMARCGPDPDVPNKCFKACAPHTGMDLETILDLHPHGRIAVVLLGGDAATAFFGYVLNQPKPGSLKKATKKNGETFQYKGRTLTTFATYHPAYLDRDPKMIHAVVPHLQLVSDWLDGIIVAPSRPNFVSPRSPRKE